MLAKQNRLSRNDLAYAMKQKTFRIEGQFVMLRIGAPILDVFQAACIVSKKVSKRAVARNTIRRRCYRALQEITPTLPPLTVTVTAKKGIEQVSYTELIHEISELLHVYEEKFKK